MNIILISNLIVRQVPNGYQTHPSQQQRLLPPSQQQTPQQQSSSQNFDLGPPLLGSETVRGVSDDEEDWFVQF